jgi:hypothetical protein
LTLHHFCAICNYTPEFKLYAGKDDCWEQWTGSGRYGQLLKRAVRIYVDGRFVAQDFRRFTAQVATAPME